MQVLTSPIARRDEQCEFAYNVGIRKPGVLYKATGYSQVGTSGSAGRIKGLGIHSNSNGTETLIKLYNTTLSKWTGSAWSSLSTAYTNNHTDKANMNYAYVDDEDRLYIATGHNDNVSFTNATTVTFITDTKAYCVESYRGRIYLGNVKLGTTTYSSRVLYSPVNADTFDNDNDFFDDMGEPITALKSYGGYLYIFSERKVARFDGSSLVFVPSTYGVCNNSCVQVSNGILFWGNRSGVYAYAGEGLPTLVSRAIEPVWDSIAAMASVEGYLDAYGRICFNTGDYSYGSFSGTNNILIYDPLLKAWTASDTTPFCRGAVSYDRAGIKAYVGDDANDKVYQISTTYGASGSAMTATWDSPKWDAGHPDKRKTFYNINVAYKPSNVSAYLTVKYRLDGATSWSAIEGSANNVSLSGTDLIKFATLRLPQYTQGQTIQLQITESSTNSWEVYRIEVEYDIIDIP